MLVFNFFNFSFFASPILIIFRIQPNPAFDPAPASAPAQTQTQTPTCSIPAPSFYFLNLII